MKISIIAAIGKNRELGKDNKLIWHIKEDLQRFKALTSGHPIIMGRKTFESIGRPLPNRTNIVITRNLEFKPAGAIVCNSVEEGIKEGIKYYVLSSKYKQKENKIHDTKYMIQNTEHEVFIIGGGQIYEQAIKKGLVDKLYLTIVDGDSDADTFFPEYSDFKKVISEEKRESDGFKYTFLELER